MAQRPPEAPLLLGEGPLWAASAAWFSGAWEELDVLVVANERLVEELGNYLWAPLESYWFQLHVACARTGSENRATAATVLAAAAALERLVVPGREPDASALIAAYRSDDVKQLLAWPPELWARFTVLHVPTVAFTFLSERGISSARAVLDVVARVAQAWPHDLFQQCVDMAEAVAAEDPTTLLDAIERAEARQLMPHAARMRIILAQRTGDRAQLDVARPVLERLRDHQFLGRLDQVAAQLA